MQRAKAILLTIVKFFVILGLIASIYRMYALSIVYLKPPFPTNIDFLLFKQAEIEIQYWKIAFYIHISTSVIALATGITQFSRSLLLSYPNLHRWSGKIYSFLVLFLAAPTGLIMGFHGEGGIFAQIAFICQALAWWWLTYKGFVTIRKGQIREHLAYMMRSYAVAMSAITLRLMTFILVYVRDWFGWDCFQGTSPTFFCHPNYYIFVAWSSWIINWLLAELLLWAGLAKYYLPKAKAENS